MFSSNRYVNRCTLAKRKRALRVIITDGIRYITVPSLKFVIESLNSTVKQATVYGILNVHQTNSVKASDAHWSAEHKNSQEMRKETVNMNAVDNILPSTGMLERNKVSESSSSISDNFVSNGTKQSAVSSNAEDVSRQLSENKKLLIIALDDLSTRLTTLLNKTVSSTRQVLEHNTSNPNTGQNNNMPSQTNKAAVVNTATDEKKTSNAFKLEENNKNAIPTSNQTFSDLKNKFSGVVVWPSALKFTSKPTSAKTLPDTVKEAKKVILHRDSITRESIERKTRGLVHALKSATSNVSKARRLEELNSHLKLYPDARSAAEGIQHCLLRLRLSGDNNVKELCNETLAIMGYVDPPKGRGIRILSLDGGGTRGLMTIEVLRCLEAACRAPVHQLFDYICGVSTGSLLAVMLAVFKVPLVECDKVYREFSRQMFTRNMFMGASKLITSHAFYDSSIWEKILVENLTEQSFLETTRRSDCPRISAISSVMNQPRIKNFVFRNYGYPMGVASYYPGSFKYRLWEAVRASSAAPGYYEEMTLDGLVHQDGGLLTNNPTAIAIHECRLLWPQESLQCVVSIGTGRFEPTGQQAANYGSLRQKINKLVQSATDTEAIHMALNDMLPPSTYFRFNPYMSEDFQLDEVDVKRWEQMILDTQLYCRKNESKLAKTAERLLQGRLAHQRARDWLMLHSKMVG